MNRIPLLAVSFLSVTMMLSDTAIAQDEEVAEFERQRASFDMLNDEIRDVYDSIRAASDDERPALRERYLELMDRIDASFNELRAATTEAYSVTGESNEQVAFALFQIAVTLNESEDYFGASELFSRLIANDSQAMELYSYAGMAAFGSNQFELASQYWKRAAETDQLLSPHAGLVDTNERLIAAWEREATIRADEAGANDLPRVSLMTSKGEVIFEMFENEAPGAVGNFISLVEDGYYDGLSFHRVLPGFMAQGGCPDGTGAGGPGYEIYCECYVENYRRHFAGTLSMAHAGRDTGGSQFFITFVPTPHLDGRHTAFGRVVEGWEVLSKLQRINPLSRGAQPEPDTIIEAKVIRKRDHEYRPNIVE